MNTLKQRSHRFIYPALWLSGLGLAIAPLPVQATIAPPHLPAQVNPAFLQIAQASSPLEQGRLRYQAGQFAEAVTLWQQAAQTYQRQGNTPHQALSLSYLAMAYKDLGQWEAARGAIAQSLDLLQTAAVTGKPTQRSPHSTLILAQVWNTQGSLQFATGDPQAALNSWKQAEAIYDQVEDRSGKLGSQINQARALQSLGLYRQTRTALEQVNEQLQAQPNSVLKARALQSLGVTLQLVGAAPESLEILQQSLGLTQQLGATADISGIQLSLGNTARALADPSAALGHYQQAAATATTAIAQVEAQLSQLSLLVETNQDAAALALLPQIQTQLPQLPASRAAIHARVNYAQSWLQLTAGDRQASLANDAPAIAQGLSTAIQQARQLQDVRAESYAMGQLGQLYESKQQWSAAQDLTEQALALASGINAADIAYQWQWQLGRILCQGGQPCAPEGDLTGAIAAYTDAVAQLRSLRSDLVANPEIQFAFRERVEPVYRELVTLLLTPQPGQAALSQSHLQQARDVIEALQLAELENFFQEACLDAQPQQIDQIDPTAAVIYPIQLPDRLAVIMAIQGQPLRYHETPLAQADLDRSFSQMRQSLNPVFPNQARLQVAQQLYDWLIRPVEPTLAAEAIQTLVFVPDGPLRSLPMAALHDGQHYLIENYGVAVTPGLQLLAARSLAPKQLKLLVGGLTEASQGFAALPAASFETEQIAAQVPAQVFLNQNFTQANLQQQINRRSFPVVHLATHGQFSSNLDNTFILAWDGKIKPKAFGQLLQSRQLRRTNPIELLVLSACQTAAGDDRAGLGLAGLAVRSGARSTLATLWSVHDQATADLMVEFYQALTQPGTTKAAALRQAQLNILQQEEYQHPFFWAAFVMIGNWL